MPAIATTSPAWAGRSTASIFWWRTRDVFQRLIERFVRHRGILNVLSNCPVIAQDNRGDKGTVNVNTTGLVSMFSSVGRA